MFNSLRQYSRIIVTGPQRSGTTICAKMIAHDTGFEYVDEDDISRDDLRLLKLVLRVGRDFVVQCPALCRHVHEVADDATAVVLMRRPVAAIIASQKRIGWKAEPLELRRYGLQHGVIAEVKYRYWETHQRARVAHPIEVEHAALKQHPLWVERDRRQEFAPRQTAPSV